MVIQRIQSIYLLLAAIAIALYALMPIAEISIGLQAITLRLSGAQTAVSIAGSTTVVEPLQGYAGLWGLFAVAALTALLALITIFKYRNLKLQRRLCAVCGVLTAALAVSIAAYVINLKADSCTVSASNLLLLAEIVLLWLANQGIRHDQRLLSSYDRIR